MENSITQNEKIKTAASYLLDQINSANDKTEALKTIAKQLDSSGHNDLLHELSYLLKNQQPHPDQKTLTVTSGMENVDDSHLMDYKNDAQRVKRYIMDQEPSRNSDGDIYEWKRVLMSAIHLEDHADTELFTRVQFYNGDIQEMKKKLNGNNRNGKQTN